MTREEVQEHLDFRVGQRVRVVEDSGFNAGIPSYHVIDRIVLLRWEPGECKRLGLDLVEWFLHFTDGESASIYDRVTPCKEPCQS